MVFLNFRVGCIKRNVMKKSREEKLKESFTFAYCLLQINRESSFSKRLEKVSKKIEKRIKDDEEFLDLFQKYKIYLIGHVLDVKQEESYQDYVDECVERILKKEKKG